MNIAAGDDLEARFPGVELILFESGGDNLASTFSLDLVDWWMFVIDVAGGDDIPRKKGPGLLRCDLLVVNKIDLAPYVGVELEPMLAEAETRARRPSGDRHQRAIRRRNRGGRRCNSCRSPFQGLRPAARPKFCWSRNWPAAEPCSAASMSDIPFTSRVHFSSTGCGPISRRSIFSRRPAASMPRTGWRWILSVGAGAALHLTTQASTVVHDGRGDGSTMRQSVTVKDQAFCAVISDPYVLFPGADLHIATTATVAADAVLIMADGFAVHDPHRRGGTFARFSSRYPHHAAGRRACWWSTAAASAATNSPRNCGALGGMAAAGSVLMIAPPDRLADIAEIEAAADRCGCLAGVTAAPNGAGLAMRLLAPDGGTLIRGIEAAFHVGARAALGVDLAPRRK